MIERKEYLNKLRAWKEQNIIKIITGIRRCKKSTLLKLFVDVFLNKFKYIRTYITKNTTLNLTFQTLSGIFCMS